MTKLWIGGALVLLLATAGTLPVAAHTAGGCQHDHNDIGSTCKSHGAQCTLPSGEEGVCRQRTRNCNCEARGADEAGAPEAGAAEGAEAAGAAAEPIRLFAEILYTPAQCAPEADAPIEGLGMGLSGRAQHCQLTCFGHSCSIQCDDGQRALCKCIQEKTPGGWQWIPVCTCV